VILREKVVTATEMARIEKLAYAAGASDLGFMENAGKGIAEKTEQFVSEHALEKRVTLLVGKGNNGGDAFAAGKHLVSRGFSVTALLTYPLDHCSPLCQKQCEEFKRAGGTIQSNKTLQGVILDGLTGTGFHGKAEGELLDAIELANSSKLPILAIDIPSGLNGDTGEVGSKAIHATVTLALGLPKIGFFIEKGWGHLGELELVDFGMDEKFIQEAKADASLINDEQAAELLPPIRRSRHKYEAGYIVAVAGSQGFSGAAFLSTLAALRSGAGIVRLFHAYGMEAELAGAPLEIVKEELSPCHCDGVFRIVQEGKRAKCFMIGPGMGRGKCSNKLLKALLPRIEIPSVFDADALFHLAENPSWEIPANSILTPHKKEMERLLGLTNPEETRALHILCREYADKKQTTIVLKGGPTFIFHPKQAPLISLHGDPGMATAGTGDVLTGILAALLAQGLSPLNAAILATTLHGLSGELAAHDKTPYSLIAHDLIDSLPDAFKLLLSLR
jgi:NAD(P)H-hydrate epimerase